MYKLYAKFAEDHASKLVGGEELERATSATTVRIQGGPGGDVVTTDGPFAETKEELAGFYVVEAEGPRRGHPDRWSDPQRAVRGDRGPTGGAGAGVAAARDVDPRPTRSSYRVKGGTGSLRQREGEMAKYLLTIYGDEAAQAATPPEELEKFIQAYTDVTEEMRSSGVYEAGEGIQPSPTAKSVRVRDGKTQTTDGPFAETKEVLNGFYLLECKSEAEAVKWAAKIPGAEFGTVEVRPVLVYPEA